MSDTRKGWIWGVGMAVLAVALVGMSVPAEAKRLGGGTSFGQRTPLIQRDAPARPAPTRQNTESTAAPTQGSTAAAPAQAAGATGAAAAARPGMAMLGGLAAGLGLAALFTALGFGEGLAAVLGNVLLIALLVGGGLLLWRMLRGGQPALAPAGGVGPLRPANPQPSTRDMQALRTAARERLPRQGYEADALAPEAAVTFEGTPKAVPTGVAGRGGVPEGFDTSGFLQGCKQNFVRLQEAWDAADHDALRAMMTDEMFTHITSQLEERGDQPNRTDVVMLQSELLVIEDLGPAYLASVEFSGMIREEVSAGATPFREIWNLTKPKDGSSGWLLAGVQALQ